MIRALIFDLDDTLYSEREFVASGYRAVAEHVCALCARSFDEVYRAMMAVLEQQGRRAVFPAVIEFFLDPSVRIDELVDVYRRHVPVIRLYAGYESLLREFRKTFQLGIITDGAPEVQQRKCRALGLEELMDVIIYTWLAGSEREKPHPKPFQMMLSRLSRQPAEAIFIGNSLDKDCRGARGVGMRSVLVCARPLDCPMAAAEETDFVIESLSQMPMVLQQLEDRNEAA